jgi:thiaminase (transcriptional activator TenA)
MIEATDEAASSAAPGLRERMHAAYRRAAQLEWMFWDSAYRQEQWPV